MKLSTEERQSVPTWNGKLTSWMTSCMISTWSWNTLRKRNEAKSKQRLTDAMYDEYREEKQLHLTV